MKAPGGVSEYPDVAIEWIRHHTPELNIINEQGKQIRTIDLSRYDYDGLHKLFASYFARRGSGRMLADEVTNANSSSSSSSQQVSTEATASRSTPPRTNDATLPSPDPIGWGVAENSSRVVMRGMYALHDSYYTFILLFAGMLGVVSAVRCVSRRRRRRLQGAATSKAAQEGVYHAA